MTTTSLAEVVELLDVEPVDPLEPAAPGTAGAPVDPADEVRFVARQSAIAVSSGHVFGGLVAAQAVVAASRTVATDRPIHSLHAYFLRPGDPAHPIELHVEPTRDGRSFSHRRVSARQKGRAIMELTSSYAAPEPGLHHQQPAPDVARPEDLEPDWRTLGLVPGADPTVTTSGPFDIRSAETHSQVGRERGERTDRSRMWMRTDPTSDVALPDDPVLHAALLTYASDMMVLDPTTRPHALSMLLGDVLPATIDHAMWFHVPARADEWFLVDVESPWAGGGRGFARGRVFDRAGTLVGEIAQEGLIRLPPPQSDA